MKYVVIASVFFFFGYKIKGLVDLLNLVKLSKKLKLNDKEKRIKELEKKVLEEVK